MEFKFTPKNNTDKKLSELPLGFFTATLKGSSIKYLYIKISNKSAINVASNQVFTTHDNDFSKAELLHLENGELVINL